MSSLTTHWMLPSGSTSPVDAICIGTGRFQRTVLTPALKEAGMHPVLVQTRGRSFLEFMQSQGTRSSYPVDTVLPSGDIDTNFIDCYGAFSWGKSEDKEAFYECIQGKVSELKVIGVGVTEAGLASSDTKAMENLFELFEFLSTQSISTNKVCVVNTDNVYCNGDVIKGHMVTIAEKKGSDILDFLNQKVVFINSMVDRITSQRPGSNGMVPRAEPQPAKALVFADLGDDLPLGMHNVPGLVVRPSMEKLELDIAWKLRIANGTHTAIAHLLALSKCLKTDTLSAESKPIASTCMSYLDSLVEHQILPAVGEDQLEAARAVWDDWRGRLLHPHFGLSSYFITQNGPAKGGIRLSPTVKDLWKMDKPVSVAMAFAYAVLLRWLTPANTSAGGSVFRGWLPGSTRDAVLDVDLTGTEEYADGLRVSLADGCYEFRCKCVVEIDSMKSNLSERLSTVSQTDLSQVVKAYLVSREGGNLDPTSQHLEVLVEAISHLLGRMISDEDPLEILSELMSTPGHLAADCSTINK